MATVCRKRKGESEENDSIAKKRAIEPETGPLTVKDVDSINIYIIKTKISSAHLVQLKQLATKNKINVCEQFRSA